jgi:cell division protein ZapD
MRLEHLFQQLNHFMAGNNVFDNRAAISVLLDILMIFNRNNLKTHLLTELDRHSKTLSQLVDNEGVDTEILSQTLEEISGLSQKLYNTNGKMGLSIMDSELFKTISQRNSIPGGTCSFDLPAFHYWLEQDNTQQLEDLHQWTEPFLDIHHAVNLVLGFIRQSSVPTQEVAEAGFFQLALDKAKPYQLLRVAIEQSYPYFAEISGGKHRFSIRFMQLSSGINRSTQVSDDIPFSLNTCVF